MKHTIEKVKELIFTEIDILRNEREKLFSEEKRYFFLCSRIRYNLRKNYNAL